MCIYVHLQEWQVGCLISRHSKGFLFSFLFNWSPSYDLMIFCSEYKVLPHQSAAELNFLLVFNPVNFKHNFLLKKRIRKRKLAHCCWLLWMDVRDNPGNCRQTLTSCSRSLLLLDRWCLGGSHRDQFWELLESFNFLQMNLFASTQWDYDLQVTGILAKQLDLDHKELNSYWTMNSSRLLTTKLQQSPLTYHKDFVAGPTGRCG